VSAGFAVVQATLSTKDSWTWTQTNSTMNSTGATSSATAAVGDPSYGYAGSISQIAVYWDTIFNSFMLAPVSEGLPFASGILYDPNHNPSRGQKVVLTVQGRIFETYTDRKGEYKFYGLAPIIAMTGKLTAGALTQTISLGPKPVKLDIGISKR
jgi:hypothetical protein